jgi:hypothetical protein
MKRWWAGVLLFWIFVITVTVRQVHWQEHAHDLPFDSAAWKAGSQDDGVMWPTRLRMADDLMASGILKGKTRAKVRQLLGSEGSSNLDYAHGDLSYVLGPERSPYGLDMESLVIHFGEDGRVSNWEIHTD